MPRIAADVSIMAVVAVVMASMILVGGSAIPPPAEPLLLPGLAVATATSGPAYCLESPVTAPGDARVVGRATLCLHDQDLHTTMQVDGLVQGATYTLWLGYTLGTAPCQDIPCGPIDLPADRPAGFMRQIGSGLVPASRTLEIDAPVREIQVLSGAQVSLLLLRPNGRAGPHAQATFIAP